MTFTPITVTGHWENADGSPLVGSVTVRLDRQISNAGVIASAVPVTLQLDANGDLVGTPESEAAQQDPPPDPVPAIFYANNDPGTTPDDSTYHWVIQVGQNVPSPQQVGYGSPPVEFDAILDCNAPGQTVDIGTLLPTEDDAT